MRLCLLHPEFFLTIAYRLFQPEADPPQAEPIA